MIEGDKFSLRKKLYFGKLLDKQLNKDMLGRDSPGSVYQTEIASGCLGSQRFIESKRKKSKAFVFSRAARFGYQKTSSNEITLESVNDYDLWRSKKGAFNKAPRNMQLMDSTFDSELY